MSGMSIRIKTIAKKKQVQNFQNKSQNIMINKIYGQKFDTKSLIAYSYILNNIENVISCKISSTWS